MKDGHEQDALENGQKAAYDAQHNEKPANGMTPDPFHAFFNTRSGPGTTGGSVLVVYNRMIQKKS
jgi:hypothetical protein